MKLPDLARRDWSRVRFETERHALVGVNIIMGGKQEQPKARR